MARIPPAVFFIGDIRQMQRRGDVNFTGTPTTCPARHLQPERQKRSEADAQHRRPLQARREHGVALRVVQPHHEGQLHQGVGGLLGDGVDAAHVRTGGVQGIPGQLPQNGSVDWVAPGVLRQHPLQASRDHRPACFHLGGRVEVFEIPVKELPGVVPQPTSGLGSSHQQPCPYSQGYRSYQGRDDGGTIVEFDSVGIHPFQDSETASNPFT